jgi:DNA-binding transcriptional regulator PaaX
MTVEKIANEKNITSNWQLEKINEKYISFIKMTQRIQRHAQLWPIQAKELEQVFADIFAEDPHLPKELLPNDWQGNVAYDKFKEISNSY